MYGQTLGANTTAVTGAVSTGTGLAVLPNTGGNVVLMALSLATTLVGAAVLLSFAYVRVYRRLHR